MSNVNNNNLFLNSSMAQSNMSSKLSDTNHKSNGQVTMKDCFDNFISIQSDVNKDNAAINTAVENIEKNLKNSASDKTAKSKAEEKAKKLTKNASWGICTVTSGAKASNNKVEFEYKDASGKKGKATIKYGNDGSYSLTRTINGVVSESIYDKNGKLRKTASKDSSTGNTTISKYDASGKINTRKVQDTKTGTVKTLNYYDDNGQLARKNSYNEGGKLASATDYEYNKDGKVSGSYTTIKPGSEKYGVVNAICRTYNGNKMSRTVYNTDGTSYATNSEKNSKTNEYEPKTHFRYTALGEVTSKTTYDSAKTEKGVTIRNTVVNRNGKTYYAVQTLDKDGKVTETKTYSDKNRKELLSTTKYSFDKEGNKTKRNIYNAKGDITSTTKYNRAGVEVSKDSYSYKYDANGKITQKTTKKDADNDGNAESTKTAIYDSNGKATQQSVKTDKNNDGKTESTTVSAYDNKGKITKKVIKTDKNGDGKIDTTQTTTYNYNSKGQKIGQNTSWTY